ncbi:hypothetical protein HMI55_004608 [Coelomomyces lativittatus]|nr:hypothetical protein HMI55_004608 [Coelomomyces lativittatus]
MQESRRSVVKNIMNEKGWATDSLSSSFCKTRFTKKKKKSIHRNERNASIHPTFNEVVKRKKKSVFFFFLPAKVKITFIHGKYPYKNGKLGILKPPTLSLTLYLFYLFYLCLWIYEIYSWISPPPSNDPNPCVFHFKSKKNETLSVVHSI